MKNNLDKSQKEFIEKKVRELKTKKKVKEFYHLDDNVSKFAVNLSEKLFKSKKVGGRKGGRPKKKAV
jgi:hypothetical protein